MSESSLHMWNVEVDGPLTIRCSAFPIVGKGLVGHAGQMIDGQWLEARNKEIVGNLAVRGGSRISTISPGLLSQTAQYVRLGGNSARSAAISQVNTARY